MRLFIAVPVDDQLEREMLRLQKRIAVDGQRVRWSSPEQLHLTLKFLGEAPSNQVPSITQVIEDSLSGLEPFEIEVGGTGCFPPHGQVRIIWVGGEDPTGSLRVIAQKLESGLEPLGFAPEKRTFSIHFTIGRVKSDHSHGRLREAVSNSTLAPYRQIVREVVLFQSELTPQGAKYTALARVRLGH